MLLLHKEKLLQRAILLPTTKRAREDKVPLVTFKPSVRVDDDAVADAPILDSRAGGEDCACAVGGGD